MTREKFIQVLGKKGYSYEIEGDKIVVTDNTDKGYVDLDSLTTLPPGVEFKNKGTVWLRSLKTLPPSVEFNNGGGVNLGSLKTLPPGVEFKNREIVNLSDLTTLPAGVEFKNKGTVRLDSLVGGRFSDWSGNIEGVDSNRLLNVMISKGLFER